MKTYYRNFIHGLIILGILLSISSCRKEFTLDEFDKLKNDELQFEGSFAIPIVNTELTLGNFIPANDSSLWAEIDENNLIHLRMYYEDLILFRMDEIYSDISPLSYPVNSGATIPAHTHSVPTDTSKMKVYDKMLAGRLYFDNPSITFFIENEIPIVTFFKMDTLTFHNYDTLAISHTDHTEYSIPAPSIENTHADTTIIIDTVAIPELAEVFSPVPRFVSFYMSAGSHNDQTLPFGVTGEEELSVDVDIDLPLDARLDTIVMADTINFDLSTDFYDQIKAITLKIKFDNGFPIDGYSQIYFVDSTDQGGIGNYVDSVFTDISHDDITEDGWHLSPAVTDAQGIVTFSTESDIYIYIDQERFNFLKESHVSKIVITGKLNSYNSHTGLYVKILGDYKMGVQIAAKADFEASSGDEF